MTMEDRISELATSAGINATEARLWVEFQDEQQVTAEELQQLIAELDTWPGCERKS